MKTHCLFLALALFSTNGLAADVGLFDISDALHPQPLQDQVGNVRIVSQSNNNRRYYLHINARSSFPVSSGQMMLMVGKEKLRFTSEGKTADRITSVGMAIEDPAIIPQITQQFHATVLNRRHPGHQILVEFLPEKAEFTAGAPVLVTLRITNIGEREFAFVQGCRQRGARDNQFAFTADKGGAMVPDSGNPVHLGGLGGKVKLKPSQSHDIKVDLTKWFKFESNSSYWIRGSYYMGFVEPEGRSFDTIWEDYACGEFTIKT